MENFPKGEFALERDHEGAFCMFTHVSVLCFVRGQVRLLWYILPVQLRDQVPIFREAFFVFVQAMRQLDGQVHSWSRAKNLGVLPGSRTFDKRSVKRIHGELIKGLCLLEGCLPISFLNPGLHHFAHSVNYTRIMGLKRWAWMLCFER